MADATAAELVPGLAVPTATRAILNAHFRVDGLAVRPPGPQEIAMQRMHPPSGIEGSDSRHQRLADHQATKHPLPADLRALAAIEVLFDRFKIEYVNEIGDSVLHDCP